MAAVYVFWEIIVRPRLRARQLLATLEQENAEFDRYGNGLKWIYVPNVNKLVRVITLVIQPKGTSLLRP